MTCMLSSSTSGCLLIIILERELEDRSANSNPGIAHARALLACNGYTVNQQAAASPPAAPAPQRNRGVRNGSDNASQAATVVELFTNTYSACFQRRRDLQTQIEEINAASRQHRQSQPSNTSRQNNSPAAEDKATTPTYCTRCCS